MTDSAATRAGTAPAAAGGPSRPDAAAGRAGAGADARDGRAPPLTELEKVLYHISHDLRAAARPMAIVPGWIREDLARHFAELPEGIEDHLSVIETHAARLDRMLLDLRTYSRVGRLSDAPARLDLAAELDAALLAVEPPPGFRVVRRLEATALVAPRNEIQLLLRAVVGNAWKHHDRPDGRITVASCRSGGALRLSVIDDGPGIERRYHEAVFAMMTTLRPRDEVEGSGLGLAIARKIVSGLGGSIEIAEPLAPRGTCVLIVLPQPAGTAEETAEETTGGTGDGGDAGHGDAGRRGGGA